ncbi:AbrB/MazE/SpoVT family DNA-binding domain-containing protein [Halonotius terrestris]|uniref:AbrB/MazE/SpoVT family DNA-binding domain-containing protein n=1 Tax=Halonotius terrestris TaxID=2487750 RepID=A0A8J8TCZ8_9EURY|nr:AbrB/MazE/SpoVT family DNA-binding domain-containing protein [Halonotius terrestris]TQQ83815.1 AbrB/MazE/SpoVT family DNA-binding domain-containing protein [Halonotius terrestris]
MPTVDSEGRIRIPEEIRDSLDLTPGTEVTIRHVDDTVVVETGPPPERILDRMETLFDEISADPEPTPRGELDAQSRSHLDAIQSGAASGKTATDDQ